MSETQPADGALIALSRTRAGAILSSPRKCAAVGYVVSIGGACDRPAAGFARVRERLRLVFDDVTTLEEGGASRKDIEHLVRFAGKVDLARGVVLVHCESGISRSTAAVLIILCVILGPGHEVEAVRHLKRTHPHARPNRLVVELADEVLARGGSLLAACREERLWSQASSG